MNKYNNKKGFTLTELLVTLCIIALIAAIAIPTIITYSNKVKKDLYDSKVTLVLEAAKEWGEVRLNELSSTECTNVKVKTLIKEGYLTGEKNNKSIMVNPITNESMNEMNVCVTFERDTVYYVSSILQDDVPKLVVKPQVLNKAYNDPYELLDGVKGYNADGDLDILITERGTEIETDTRLSIGSHTITYTVTDGKYTTTGERTYTIAPPRVLMAVEPAEIVIVKGTQYNLLTGVSAESFYAEDNPLDITITENGTELEPNTNLAIGQHTITYKTSPDQNEQTATKQRKYVIVEEKKSFAYVQADQSYTVPITGRYQIEAYGARGANNGGYGGYLKATVFLTAGDKLIINTGGTNGYNGGGVNSDTATYNGGGATTIKVNEKYIIAVAGGGATGQNGTVGTAGGSNSGSGGAAAHTNGSLGTNGKAYIGTTLSGGGSSSPNKTYSCNYGCWTYTYDCQKCKASDNPKTTYKNNYIQKISFLLAGCCCGTYWGTCSGESCGYSTCTAKGLPGNGGTTVVANNVTVVTKTAGVSTGNGTVSIAYISYE